VTKPTPSQLRSYAADLRGCAREQRRHAHSCEALLHDAAALANDDTWMGTYASQVNTKISHWVKGLHASAAQLRTEAKSWDSLADEFEQKAAAAD